MQFPTHGSAQPVRGFLAGVTVVPDDRCLHHRFEFHAESVPGAVAVEFSGRTIAYGEINAQANRLARHLQRSGVGPDCPVAVLLPRSADLVVALLAILKAGGAYVPLDASCPPERVRRILEDAGAPIVITSAPLAPATAEISEGTRCLLMDSLPPEVMIADAGPVESDVRPEHLAYVIYTSGSTGRPKGVAIEHRQLSAFLDWAAPLFSAAGSGAPVQSSVSFDLSVSSLWLPLVTGRTVVMVPEEDSLDAFAELVRQNRDFSLLKVTPSHLEALDRLLGDADVSRAARNLVVGGEAFAPRLAARWRQRIPKARIFNEYGPTETTVGCAVHEVSEADFDGGNLSIGLEVPGTRIEVMGTDGLRVPEGGTGELWVGGAQVARGYWRDVEQTAAQFVPDPDPPGSGGKFYRTGDRGRRRADGTLEYLGRLDRQVKIRGHRVEPDEIEAALISCPGVHAAVVDAAEGTDGLTELVAYLVPTPGADLVATLIHDHLTGQLAAYMVPARFRVIRRLPLTPNGKVDRRALSGLESAALASGGKVVGVRTPTELQVSKLWEAALGRGDLGVTDNFFALGGHSLTALTLMASVQRQIGFGLRFADFLKNPTIAGMAALLDGRRDATGKGSLAISRAGDIRWAPATGEQVNIWITQQIAPDPSAYNVVYAARLRGPVDPVLLDQALRTVVSRQDILRTQFRLLEDDLIQDVVSLTCPKIDWEDVRSVPSDARQAAVDGALATAARVVIEPEVAPLWRFRALRVADDDQVFVWTLHHALVDEWSMHLLFAELEVAYRLASGEAVDLPELPVRFVDFSIWQHTQANEADLASHEAYWRKTLAGYPGAMRLPADRSAPSISSGRGDRLAGTIPSGVRAGLRRLAHEECASEFVVMLAAWQAWLGCRCGDREVLVATPVAQREQAEVQHLAGLFLRTLPIRVTVDFYQDFRSFVRQVRERVTQSVAHAALPLARILEAMPRVSATGASPFSAAFALVDRGWPQLHLPGTVSQWVPVHTGTAKFDLLLAMTPGLDGGWVNEFEYSTDRFSPGRILELLNEFQQFVATVAQRPDAPAFGRSVSEEGEDLTVPGRFRRQVARGPDTLALVCDGRQWTYSELDRDSDLLAAELQVAGVGHGGRVGLHLDRSPEWVIAALAVLKSGAAYVPLQPGWPASRLKELAEEARIVCVIGAGTASPDWLAVGIPVLDGVASRKSEPTRRVERGMDLTSESPAYVLFTSGSTGKPKGVLVPHRAVHRLVVGQDYVPFGPGLRCLHLSSPSFDASTFEVWAPLLNGGACVVLRAGHPDVRAIDHAVKTLGANCLFLTTGLFNHLVDLDPGALEGTTHILTGGEELSEAHARKAQQVLPQTRLIHCYGPTETTTFATTGEIPPAHEWSLEHPVPIGRELAGTRGDILDPQGSPVAPGEPGELYLGGDGVALGYVNDAELTALRFVPDPADPTGRARRYRTRDRVRRLPDGRLVFLGRLDAQVKIRGHRIEPAEIEGVLCGHPMVRQAFVVSRRVPGGVQELVACIHRQPGIDWNVDALRGHLRGRLPEYMMPAIFRELDTIPLMATGKVDRAALASQGDEAPRPPGMPVAPRTPMEDVLHREWLEVLRRPTIGIHDNFFDLGGQSLVALRLVARLQQVLHRKVRIEDLFLHPTIARLAESFEPASSPEAAVRQPFQGRQTGSPWFHVPGIYGVEFLTAEIRSLIGRNRPFFDGLQYPGLDGDSDPLASVEAIAGALAIQVEAIHPAGPLWLSGFSFGGSVAYELARQLTVRGRTVEGVVMFDTSVRGALRRRPFREWMQVLATRTVAHPPGGRIPYFAGLLSKKAGDLFQRLRRSLGRLLGRPRERLETASLAAHGSFRPRGYDGTVYLFRATQVLPRDTGVWIRDEFNGWKGVMGPRFALINLDCDHERVFLEPVSPEVLKALGRLLETDA